MSVSPLCMHWGIDDSSVRLRPNPTFLPKVLSPEFINQVIDLPAYMGSSDPRRQRLCPVRALRCYVTATAELRRSDQLFVCFSPGKLGSPLSKQRLSQWFIEVVKAAYDQAGQTLPPLITGHSLRSVATSWAALKGTPLSEICAAATWSSPCVFSRFYRVNVAAPHSLAATVLA